MGALLCFFRGHKDTEVNLIGTRARVRWCPVCKRVRWID